MSQATTPENVSAPRLALLARRARQDGLAALLREPIAVIGMGCRFPGSAHSPERFWDLLRQRFDGIREVPADRWSVDEWFDADSATPGKTSVRHAGFLDDIAGFDAEFFGISGREAERMDPHQRLALEVVWEALEDAGLALQSVWEKRVGVFAASYNNDYVLHQYLRSDAINERTITGVVHSIVANRISYYLGLHGPSLTIDTACSSSLVAVHLAVQSLRSGDSDVALAGGVSLMLRAEPFVAMSKAGFMSPDGRCKTFDARADGFGRGEGCGFIVLKRLSDALAAGDRIDAVIRGSAVNQDGRSTVLAAPNGRAQVDVVRAALADGAVDPSTVSLIEAHGTGTRLGDPIEVESLAEALGPARDGRRMVASVKSNIGHLEAAAGIAGLIKAVLSIRHRTIPPQVQFEQENPLLRLADHGFEVPRADRTWEPAGTRIVGVSSFGVGGTNAHVVLEEPPSAARAGVDNRAGALLVLSARTDAARDVMVARYADLLDGADDANVQEVCAAAALYRTPLDERIAIVAESPKDLAALLRSGPVPSAFVRTGRVDSEATPRVVFVCNGQGSQWAGMAAQLLTEEPHFRQTIEEVDALFLRLAGWSLVDALEGRPVPYSIDDTACAQPLIFAIQIGLARLFEHWGVQPFAAVGHSIGEIAAACITGHITLEEAVPIVFHRGRVMQQASADGAMLAARMDEAAANAAIAEAGVPVALAAVNGPRSVVFSGNRDAVHVLEKALVTRGVQVRALTVRYAFHSREMHALEGELRDALDPPAAATPAALLISTVTGDVMPAGTFTPAYVARNVVSPVRFNDAVMNTIRLGGDVFLELGPRAVLGSNLTETIDAAKSTARVIPALTQQHAGRAGVLGAVGALFCAGVAPKWDRVLGRVAPVPVLPVYPWQHERCWLDAEERRSTPGVQGDALLGVRVESPAVDGVLFQRTLTVETADLADHCIGGHCLMPAVMMLEMARVAGTVVLGENAAVQDAEFLRPVTLDDTPREISLWVRASYDVHSAELHARARGGAWQLVFRCTLRADRSQSITIETPVQDGSRRIEAASFYGSIAGRGYDFGPRFRRVEAIDITERRASAPLSADAGAFLGSGLTPGLLDSALQPAITLIDDGDQLYVPSGIGTFQRMRDGVPMKSIVTDVSPENGPRRFDADLLGADGSVLAIVRGLVMRAAPADFLVSEDIENALYGVDWVAAEAPAAAGAAPGYWVVTGRGAFADSVAAQLVQSGRHIDRVLDVNAAESRAIFEAAGRSDRALGWVLADAVDADDTKDLDTYQQNIVAPVLEAVHTFRPGRADYVVLLSRGAYVTDGDTSARGIEWSAASLSGLSRTIRRELPEAQCVHVDLDPASDPAAGILDLILDTPKSGEPVIAVRGTQRLVPRLTRTRGGSNVADESRDVLELAAAGDLASIRLARISREAPGPDEVEIEVYRGALNFRDVLASLGVVTARTTRVLGHECAGIVVRTGSGVKDVKPGDEVVALAEGAFGDFVTCPRERVFPKPRALAWEAAAAVPIAYLTAWHALITVAGVQKNQRVLVHSGAGGVGLATVRLALSRGATVYATAGTEEKRAFLRDLGVQAVSDSRSTQFHDDILAATNGAGVDVVVNSLTGAAVNAGLSLLRGGGCFIELGKREIRNAEDVARAYAGVRYAAFDLFDEIDRDAEPYRAAFAEISRNLESGVLAPLPNVVFPKSQAVDAFRLMQRGAHTGKILLSFSDRHAAPCVRSDATYIIAGGTGVVGLATAAWLVGRGARRVVLASRNEPVAAVLDQIEALRHSGAEIVWRAVDLTDAAAVHEFIAGCASGHLPLRGVVHAAAVLKDGLLSEQGSADFLVPFRSKVGSVSNLVDALDPTQLDFLLLYSAAGSLLDPAGQGSYASANAAIDALAAHLRSRGYPAISIASGLWQGGMAANLSETQSARWTNQGLRAITPGTAAPLFDRVLACGRANIAPLFIDWNRYFRQRVDADPVTSSLRPRIEHSVRAGQQAADRLRAEPPHLRRSALRTYLTLNIARVLGRAELDDTEADRPLRDLGLDSLMAVELRNLLTRELGQPLPATLVFDYPDVPALIDYVGGLLFGQAGAPVVPSATPATEPVTTASVMDDVNEAVIAGMSDEEAERLLLEELSLLGADAKGVYRE